MEGILVQKKQKKSKPTVGAAVGAGPGDAVAGQAPGVFFEAGLADLEPAGADPAELLPLTAAVALKSAPGLSGSGKGINGLIHGIVAISPYRRKGRKGFSTRKPRITAGDTEKGK